MTDDAGESEMDLDEAEVAAKRDHENATEQIEGTQGKAAARRRARKKAQEQSGSSSTMDTSPEIRNEAGKRTGKEAGNADPPPKALQLPPNTEHYNLAKEDGSKQVSDTEAAKALAANAAAQDLADKAKKELDEAAAKKA